MKRRTLRSFALTMAVSLALLMTMQAGVLATDPPPDEDAQGLSLITETPGEGFAVAVALSRKAITETQPDTDVLHALRPGYAHDADSLIAVSHVIATNYQTVAAANDHWR